MQKNPDETIVKESHKALIEAVNKSDIPVLNQLLVEKSTIDCIDIRDEKGCTALNFATKAGNQDIVESLVKAGAGVNISDNNGYTALHFASLLGHGKIVEFLLQNQADRSLKNNRGHNALEVTKQVIGNYANMKSKKPKDEYEKIASSLESSFERIISAIENREDFKKIEPLINSLPKADFDKYDQNGMTILHLASASGLNEHVKCILRNQDYVGQINDRDGKSAIHYAAEHGHSRVIETLLNAKEEVDKVDQGATRKTPLQFAIVNNKLDGVRTLLRNKAKIDKDTEHTLSPINLAAFMGNANVFGEIWEKAMNNSDYFNEYVIKSAFESVEEGKKRFAMINTPSDHDQVIKILTENMTTTFGQNHHLANMLLYLQEASSTKRKTGPASNSEMLGLESEAPAQQIIVSVPVSVDNPLMFEETLVTVNALQNAIWNENSVLVKNLSTDVNVVNESEKQYMMTPLHLAVKKGNIEIIEILLQAGANPNVNDLFNKTPLHYAIDSNNRDVINLIMNAEIKKNAEIEENKKNVNVGSLIKPSALRLSSMRDSAFSQVVGGKRAHEEMGNGYQDASNGSGSRR